MRGGREEVPSEEEPEQDCPPLVGALSTTYGLGGALTFLAIAFVAGVITIFFLRETRRELS